jgi:multidrug resistance efflux pump
MNSLTRFVFKGLMIIVPVVVLGVLYQTGYLSSTHAVKASPSEETSGRVNIMPVSVVKIQPVNVYTSTNLYTGKVVPRRRSQLGFEVSGRIADLVVDEGDHVTANMTLGTLEKDRLLSKLEQTRAEHRRAQSQLDELMNGSRTEDVKAAEAQIHELETEFNRLESTLARQKELYTNKVITRDAYETTYFSWLGTKEKLELSSQNLLKLQNGARKEQIAAQQAAVDQYAEILKGIQIDLEDCELKAPYEGQVVKRLKDEGEVVANDNPIFELIESKVLEIRVGVPVKTLDQLRKHNDISVITSRGPAMACWKTLVPEIDPVTRTQTLILSVPPDQLSKYVVEDIVRIELEEEHKIDGYWVPTTSLVQAGKGLWGCYRAENRYESNLPDKQHFIAKLCVVETLYVRGDLTLIRGTLHPHDLIVSSGAQKIVNGQTVQPTEPKVLKVDTLSMK